jgi:hypothetical protein
MMLCGYRQGTGAHRSWSWRGKERHGILVIGIGIENHACPATSLARRAAHFRGHPPRFADVIDMVVGGGNWGTV